MGFLDLYARRMNLSVRALHSFASPLESMDVHKRSAQIAVSAFPAICAFDRVNSEIYKNLQTNFGGIVMLPDFGKIKHYIGKGVAVRAGASGARKMKIISVSSCTDSNSTRITEVRLRDENGFECSAIPTECFRNRHEVLELYNRTFLDVIEQKIEILKANINMLRTEYEYAEKKLESLENERADFLNRRMK